jgi:hypothetical protein
MAELDNDEENDFACAAVLTTHTQDVKQLKWHPQKDVSIDSKSIVWSRLSLPVRF